MSVILGTDEEGTEVVVSAEEEAEKRELAYGLEVTIKTAIAQGRESMWLLAKALHEFNEESGWIPLGYESQGEWLAQPEIGMSKRQYHRLVRLYRETVVVRSLPESQMAEIDPSKVEIVLPSIEQNETTVVQAMEDARTMGVRDLREQYIGPQGASKNGSSTAKEAPKEDAEPYFIAAQAVDSWLDLGGRKDKAVRNYAKFMEQHPVLVALRVVGAAVNGEEVEGETPDKTDAKEAWKVVVKGLKLGL